MDLQFNILELKYPPQRLSHENPTLPIVDCARLLQSQPRRVWARPLFHLLGSFPNWGYHLGGLHNKDKSIWGSILGSPNSGATTTFGEQRRMKVEIRSRIDELQVLALEELAKDRISDRDCYIIRISGVWLKLIWGLLVLEAKWGRTI